ncbi:MAG: 23S rRNA (guanosine(2251)-2'-O)-methyltransferase RlmB [Flavobacteriales bacterium]|nr:23S rRNA (guanosine(2251)-2'-O)-methyltransferase RlmB [Flavobacteriales bacterium]
MKEKENIVFGVHPVIEAIKSGKEIEKVYIQQDIQGQGITELRNAIKQAKVPVSHVPVFKLNKYTKGNHQGVVAVISPIITQDAEETITKIFDAGKVPLILMLDRVTDVRNFGAITRTAECMGVNAIIIPKRESAQINEDAVKTSSGAIYRIPICKVENLTDALFMLKSSGIQVVSCTEKTNKHIGELDLTVPTAIIMGSEENGIANQLLKNSNYSGKIPMAGEIASLNVSVAVGMVLYEVAKQRKI